MLPLYQPPEAKEYKQKFDALTLFNKEKRRPLVKLLTAVSLATNYSSATNEEKHRLLMAAAFVCLEFTKEESAVFKNSISFRRELQQALHLNEKNICDPQTRLGYIIELFHFMERQAQLVSESNMIRSLIVDAANKVFKRMIMTVTLYANILPLQKELDQALSSMDKAYLEAKKDSQPNPEREVYAQLASVLPLLLPVDQKTAEKDSLRSYTIKMGCLIYIACSINSEWSVLYKLALNALNVNRLRYIKFEKQMECLRAFKNYLNDANVRMQIDACSKELFGDKSLLNACDTRLDATSTEIDKMLDGSHHHMTIFSQMFSYVGEAVGVISGAAAGALTTQTTWGNVVREACCFVTHKMMELTGISVLTWGNAVAASFAANTFATVAIVVCFAKVLGELGKVVGLGAGKTIDFSLEMTYEGMQSLCEKICEQCAHDKEFAKNIDLSIIKLLARLPKEVVEGNQELLDFDEALHFLEQEEKNTQASYLPLRAVFK